MSINEMFRLQGFDPLATQAVSSCAIGGKHGNGMSLNVVVRLLALALPTVGASYPSALC